MVFLVGGNRVHQAIRSHLLGIVIEVGNGKGQVLPHNQRGAVKILFDGIGDGIHHLRHH